MTAAAVDYRILGPLEAVSEGEAVTLGGPTQRALLAALLLHANEPVSADRLVDLVWGQKPPATAQHAVSVYVSKLRKALGADAIGRTRSGYIVRVAPGRLDLERFQTLVATARQDLAAGDATGACELLDEALALWRGPALTDVRLEDLGPAMTARLDELRLAAVEVRVEAKLALGRHRELVGELDGLAAAHPHDERLRGLLMLALYRSGRQGEALSCFQEIRVRLSEELGIEPSQSLQELERKILSQDRSLEIAPEADGVRSVVVLPETLDQLDELARLAEPFGLSQNPHEVILAWLERPGSAPEVSSALAEASERLARLRAGLVERGARARVAAFTAADRAEDVLRLARRPEVDLLVLGRDLPAEGAELDAEMLRILAAAPCDVAVWFARDAPAPNNGDAPVVVPFGALENDWAALELAAWIATTTQRPLVVAGAAGDSRGEQRDASRLLADAGLLLQRSAGVVAHPRLAESGRDGLLAAVADAGLVVAGLSERWASEGLGDTRHALASSASPPVLFIRRGQRPGGLSPPEGVTLHRWSVTAAVR
jgi:DNA-binding SARP family transcriptional activator